MQAVLSYVLFAVGDYEITVRMLCVAALVLLVTKGLAGGVARFVLRPFFRRNNVDLGRSYAVTRIIRYVIYTAGFFMSLSLLNIAVSALWAAGAALLVGIGIGLQQTFNDFFCGFLLLIEGPVEVGNVIEVDDLIGRVVEIGLRTSKVRTRDDIMIIVPNSHLINTNITNWSHNRRPLRFHIDVGVAYGSDVKLVTRVLEEAANDHKDILERPAARVMFRGFGTSSLDFELYFYSQEHWRIEFVKSDLRYRINELFVEHGVQIPFPQQDLWLRNPEVLAKALHGDAAAAAPKPANGTTGPKAGEAERAPAAPAEPSTVNDAPAELAAGEAANAGRYGDIHENPGAAARVDPKDADPITRRSIFR